MTFKAVLFILTLIGLGIKLGYEIGIVRGQNKGRAQIISENIIRTKAMVRETKEMNNGIHHN